MCLAAILGLELDNVFNTVILTPAIQKSISIFSHRYMLIIARDLTKNNIDQGMAIMKKVLKVGLDSVS